MRLANGLAIARTRGKKELTVRIPDLTVPRFGLEVDWDKELRKLGKQK